MFRDPCCFSVANPTAGQSWSPKIGCSLHGSHYPGTWGWYADSRQRCLNAAAQHDAPDCCYGWSDFVYVPARALPEFARLLRAPAFRGLFHEVAVPTVVNTLVRRGLAKWRLLPRCQGSSMTPRVNQMQLGKLQYCAHRIDLKDEKQRAVLRATLEVRK